MKMDLALNKLQRLICHKTQPAHTHTHVWESPSGLIAKVLGYDLEVSEFELVVVLCSFSFWERYEHSVMG